MSEDLDDWPDPATLARGLLAALAAENPVAADWAGELLVAIDRALGTQTAAVLAQPAVAHLEAAWRGVAIVLAAPSADVRVVDATAAELADGHAWLGHLLYAGPIDTRGGQPISLLVTGSPLPDEAVTERALCPVVTGEIGPPLVLRPPLSADPDWATWFADAPDAARPLLGSAAYAVAAAAVRSVHDHGWPFDLPSDDTTLPWHLMAARFAQLVAVWCRDHRRGDPAPASVAADVADALRGRFVGPRLPLRRCDVEPAPDGPPSLLLHLAPRLGGDDPADVTVTLRVPLPRP